nr:N-6 DNA methylase [Phycisphaerales bacterium]
MDAPPPPAPTPQEFVANWKNRKLTERSSAQAHFIQLCRMLGVSAPLDNHDEADYCFDAITAAAGSHVYARSKSRKGAPKPVGHNTPDLFAGAPSAPSPAPAGEVDGTTPSPRERSEDGGGTNAPTSASLYAPDSRATRIVPAAKGTFGFADVWKRGCFCWEYKRQGKHADLSAALDQLKQYRDSLDNPPLLIVCDVDHYEIHTNFTGYPTVAYRFSADELVTPSIEFINEHKSSPLFLLREAFNAAASIPTFRPKRTLNDITVEFAGRVAKLVLALNETPGGPKTIEGKPVTPHEVAHFMMQVVFCLFAQNVNLLPAGRVTSLIRKCHSEPHGSELFARKVRALFKAMEKGGDYGDDTIDHFNGGLFKDVDKQNIPVLNPGQLGLFVTGQDTDWSALEPSILGTLFERALDPDQRAQIGAHYTSRDDIMLIIGPVIMDPLRREWAAVHARVNALLPKRDKAKGAPSAKAAQEDIATELKTFHARLASISVLDPACGSGNFLYVAIQCLLDLEKEVLDFAGLPEVKVSLKPKVNPTQLHGIEINEYAAELARISIWIGYLKWKKERAAYEKTRPILHPLDTIEQRDAILDRSSPKTPLRARWPKADFIVGNPPFLGSKLFRKWGMQDDYLEALWTAYDLPRSVDLCCYWFEKARQAIERHPATRAGLLATQGIRGGDNRTVLERIQKVGDIFMAWSDRDWLLNGAAVHVSMVGFDNGSQSDRSLNGKPARVINPDLSTGTNTSSSHRLPENAGIAFMGDTKGGAFDLTWQEAARLLRGTNPNRLSNRQVILTWPENPEPVRMRVFRVQ